MLYNEEDIRGKLLLPFLKDLGFDISEIDLEKDFSIKLGRSTEIKKTFIKGRSDLLCKRNGKNLFIIELKNDSISITDDDRDQGISYARALKGNIAPFVVVTNGKNTKVFDTITEEELTDTNISQSSSFWKNNCTLSTDEELQIRYEALKSFISFSKENLKTFCESQVRDRMGSIVGGFKNSHSKFVKELHAERQILKAEFNRFLNSEASVFGLVGVAGVGKTSSMCSLAFESLENHFVFFYNAALLTKSPNHYILTDLNLFFSARNESDIILKKLNELGSFSDKEILIFIDGIDECTDINLVHELSEMAYSVSKLNKLKICISCKSNIWSKFLDINGSKTYLWDELKKFHNDITSLKNSPGFLLDDFNNQEVNNILPLYKNTFGFKGELSIEILNKLKNGFFLRIFSEVYSKKEVPQKIDDTQLIKKYLKQSFQKTSLGEQMGLRILSKIGKIIMNYKYSSLETFKDEGVEIGNILDELDFSLDENIPEELFGRNILIKSNNEDSYNISFYYSKIRDYIICYHSYKLEKLNDDKFYNILHEFYENHIGESAIDFYIKNAEYSHRNILIQYKKDKALQYVIAYNAYLEENFKAFKDKFNPETKGSIGIVIPNDLIGKGGYALFPLAKESDTKVIHDDLRDPFEKRFEENSLLKKGVTTVYGSDNGLLILDQSEILKNNIFEQLREIIEKGKLVCNKSAILLLEKVSTILYYNHKRLGYKFDINDYDLPRFDLIYPINLIELKFKISKYKITRYLRRKKIDENLIPEMVEQILQGMTDSIELNELNGYSIFDELEKYVHILLEMGYKEIDSHYFPYPDKLVEYARHFVEQNREENHYFSRMIQYSENQGKLYIINFFKYLEQCYKEFIEYNFPLLKKDFLFYNEIPHEYFCYMKDTDILKWGTFGYRASRKGKLEVYFKDSTQSKEAFDKENLHSLQHFSLDIFLHINDDYIKYPIKTIQHSSPSKVDEFCVLRNWIYKFLEDDIRDLFKENDVWC
ncbi:type I restriction enzyme HsdR N-terminal domain-containing protein [Kordia sp.]|uniref:type I restriction enzyme HsdR N-terminal domain-containing protein n=1 Tax=Kordia sp. TaxID=1965332 RepID=UPI003D2DA5A5